MTAPVRALLVVCLALIALGTPAPGLARQPATPTPPAAELTPAEQRVENVIAAARAYLGVPYRLGAEGPAFMDCSGLIYRAFSDAGEARRMSGARLGVRSYVRWFAAHGGLVLDEAEAVRGDLPIWGAGQHMGVYLGDGRAISAVTSGVTVHALHGIGLPLTGFLRPDWSGAGRVEPLDPSLLLDQSETPVGLVPPSAWAPALDPSAEGAQPERAGAERVDMRTATSRTFEAPDGTFTTELHAQPIYYQPPDSTDWLPIDLRFAALQAADGRPAGVTVSASPVAVNALPVEAARTFLTLAAGERVLSIARVGGHGAEQATPVVGVGGRSVDYFDFFGDEAGLRVLGRPDGMRGFIVLGQEPGTNHFSFRLSGEDTTATKELDGSVTLRDPNGAAVGRIPRPLLLDSSDVAGDGGGVFSAATSLAIAPADDGSQTVTFSVARRFLAEAVYPAFIDFSIVDFPAVAPGADLAVVSSRHPSSSFSGGERPEEPSYGEAWLGRRPGSHNDSVVYLRFDDPRTVIGDADIAGAALEVYPYWGSDGAVPITVGGVDADWAPEAVSWLSQPMAETDLGSMTLQASEWARIELAEAPAYGFMLAAAQPGPGSWTRLIARDQSAEIAFGPRLVVTWSGLRPTLGLAADSTSLAPILAWTRPDVAGEQTRFEVQVISDDYATVAAESGIVRGARGAAATWALRTDGLAHGTYGARVRFRSAEVGWSDWSAPFTFRFGEAPVMPIGWLALEAVHGDD